MSTKQKEWYKDWFNSPYYHKLYNNRNRFEAASFIQKLVSKIHLPKHAHVVDLACGKGRHSQTLAELGFHVLGLDLSPKNIASAKKGIHQNPEFRIHDMRDPLEQEQFDAVFNLFTSFGYFDSLDENGLVISQVKQSLKPEGLFIQDYLNAQYVKNTLVESETIFRAGIEYQISKRIEDSQVIKTIAFEDNSEEFKFEERVRLFSVEEFEEMYTKAGLSIITTYGNYDLEEFDSETSSRLILISKPSHV